jgi:predicted component of type VI protein secretion system
VELTLEWQVNGHAHTFTMTHKEAVVIGRQRDCDVVLADPRVSRRHAMIFFNNGVFYLRNVSRTNPIHVNDRAPLSQKEIMPLKTGSFFTLGPLEVCVTAIQKLSRREILERARQLQVKCHGCDRKVSASLKHCPWCGASLAFSSTVY